MSNGRCWLIPLGRVAPALTVAAALWRFRLGLPPTAAFAVFLAAELAAGHVPLTLRAGRMDLGPHTMAAAGEADQRRSQPSCDLPTVRALAGIQRHSAAADVPCWPCRTRLPHSLRNLNLMQASKVQHLTPEELDATAVRCAI